MPIRVKTENAVARTWARRDSRESLSSTDHLIAVYSLESKDPSFDQPATADTRAANAVNTLGAPNETGSSTRTAQSATRETIGQPTRNNKTSVASLQPTTAVGTAVGTGSVATTKAAATVAPAARTATTATTRSRTTATYACSSKEECEPKSESTKSTQTHSYASSSWVRNPWIVCFPPQLHVNVQQISERLKLETPRIAVIAGGSSSVGGNDGVASQTSVCSSPSTFVMMTTNAHNHSHKHHKATSKNQHQHQHQHQHRPKQKNSNKKKLYYNQKHHRPCDFERQEDAASSIYVLPFEHSHLDARAAAALAFSDDDSSCSWASQNAVKFNKKLRPKAADAHCCKETTTTKRRGNRSAQRLISPRVVTAELNGTLRWDQYSNKSFHLSQPHTSQASTSTYKSRDSDNANVDADGSTTKHAVAASTSPASVKTAIKTAEHIMVTKSSSSSSIVLEKRDEMETDLEDRIVVHYPRMIERTSKRFVETEKTPRKNQYRCNQGASSTESMSESKTDTKLVGKEMRIVASMRPSKESQLNSRRAFARPTVSLSIDKKNLAVATKKHGVAATESSSSLRSIKKTVRFTDPLVTSQHFRPKTRPEDVSLLYFDEDELEILEEDRETTSRDQFEMIAQELSENRLRISIAYQNRWRDHHRRRPASANANAFGETAAVKSAATVPSSTLNTESCGTASFGGVNSIEVPP